MSTDLFVCVRERERERESVQTSVVCIDKTESSQVIEHMLCYQPANSQGIVATNLYDSLSDLWARVDNIDQKMTLQSHLSPLLIQNTRNNDSWCNGEGSSNEVEMRNTYSASSSLACDVCSYFVDRPAC
jgi:hypothetical protein